MESALAAAKQNLRSLMKTRLGSISQESIIQQSRAALEAIQNFEPYRDAQRISIYLAMPSGEIQTDAIVRHALSSGKAVFIPYLYRPAVPPSPGAPSRVMDMVRLASIDDYEALKPDKWGIPSVDPTTVHERESLLDASSGDESTAGLDFMLMPGVAFDMDTVTGGVRRLGHGRGFYDYFIHRYLSKFGSQGSRVNGTVLLRYGLGLEEQYLTAPRDVPIPIGPLDKELHGVILGSGEIHKATRQIHDI